MRIVATVAVVCMAAASTVSAQMGGTLPDTVRATARVVKSNVSQADSIKAVTALVVGADSNITSLLTDGAGTAHMVTNWKAYNRLRAGIGFQLETYSGVGPLNFRMYHWGNGTTGSAYGTALGYTFADTLGRWGFSTPGYPDSTVSVGGGISASGGMLLGGKLSAGPAKFTGDVKPGAGATYDLGASGTQWDSIFAHHALVVGDMPHYDDRNDLALIRAIRPSSIVDPVTGAPQVDDATVPREILALWRSDGADTLVTDVTLDSVTVRTDTVTVTRTATDSTRVTAYLVPLDSRGRTGDARPVYGTRIVSDTQRVPVRRVVARGDTTVRRHRTGDPILDQDGKPYIDLTAAHGLTMGAVRQLAAADDSLRLRIASLEQAMAELRTRLSAVERH